MRDLFAIALTLFGVLASICGAYMLGFYAGQRHVYRMQRHEEFAQRVRRQGVHWKE